MFLEKEVKEILAFILYHRGMSVTASWVFIGLLFAAGILVVLAPVVVSDIVRATKFNVAAGVKAPIAVVFGVIGAWVVDPKVVPKWILKKEPHLRKHVVSVSMKKNGRYLVRVSDGKEESIGYAITAPLSTRRELVEYRKIDELDFRRKEQAFERLPEACKSYAKYEEYMQLAEESESERLVQCYKEMALNELPESYAEAKKLGSITLYYVNFALHDNATVVEKAIEKFLHDEYFLEREVEEVSITRLI